MLFGNNILPNIPARWSKHNSTMTSSNISLGDNGRVWVSLTEEDIPIVYETMRLTIIADNFTDGYIPTSYVEINIKTKAGEFYNMISPIVDVHNNIFTTEIALVTAEYESFIVTIRSTVAMTITSWEIRPPADVDMSGVINEIKGDIPKLLYNYNTARFIVDYQETTIAHIPARLLANMSLNGHLQITYNASEDAMLVLRIKTDGVSELFTPIVYDIKAGRGSIGVPHAYIYKLIGIHSFTVSAQVSSGELFFDVRSILYTIDGGQLVERVMDIGMDTSDIALRRTAEEAEPSWIYAIGIDDGKALVRNRPYSENINVAWEPVITLGEAVEAAIEFEGTWRIDGNIFRFETEDQPHCFWVDPTGILRTQYGDDESRRRELASNVTKIAVVKGYRNPTYWQNDHGLVVVYLKGGSNEVYYRGRCILADGSFAWEAEREIEEFTGVPVDVTAFRTNDYRIGFNVLNSNNSVTTFITERNWAGIGIRAENIVISPTSLKIDVVPVAYYEPLNKEYLSIAPVSLGAYVLYADSFNEFLSVENTDDSQGNYGIYVTCSVKHEMFSLNKDDFELVDSLGVRFRGQSVQKINETDYKIEFEDFNNAFGEVSLVCKGDITTNAAGYLFDSFNIGFIPEDLEPDTTEPPEVDSIWNE